MDGSLLLINGLAVTKMIIFQAAYQTAITLLLHFGGQKLLQPVTKAEVNETQFG